MSDSRTIEARILVCDPLQRIMHGSEFQRQLFEHFGGTRGSSEQTLLRAIFGEETDDPISVTHASTLEEVKAYIKLQPAPYYSLVIYDPTLLREEGSAQIVAAVHKHDPLLPQMIVSPSLDEVVLRVVTHVNRRIVKGDSSVDEGSIGSIVRESMISAELAGTCARAGILYYASNPHEFRENIAGKIFRRQRRLPHLTVVKVGGSAFDYDRQNRVGNNLRNVCRILSKIHQERAPNPRNRDQVNRILVTVGAGQFGDAVKDWYKKYGDDPRVAALFPQMIADALDTNLQMMRPHFDFDHPDGYGKPQVLGTGAYYYINKGNTSQRIPLIATAPHWVLARDRIPLQDSDTHTVALAEFYGAERIVLIKRTDGVYDFDPYRGFVLDQQTYNCADFDGWRREQRQKNHRHSRVTIPELLEGSLSREGTGIDGKADGSTGHLMEDSALRYMLKKCHTVREIIVVHVAPEEMYYRKQGSGNVHTHVVTGEKRRVDASNGGWGYLLEENLRRAFTGQAPSKIVRE